jgi:hypothetical protein
MLRGHAYCLLVARSSGFCTPQRRNASDTERPVVHSRYKAFGSGEFSEEIAVKGALGQQWL